MSKMLNRKGRKGFTLVELAVVIVIIGVLASFGVPKFMQSVERSKASEAFNFLSAVRAAQERYQAKEGTYATDWTNLDIQWKVGSDTKPVLQYFELGDLEAGTDGLEKGWQCILTRKSGAGGAGAYKVGFTQDGYDATLGTPAIPDNVNPLGKSS